MIRNIRWAFASQDRLFRQAQASQTLRGNSLTPTQGNAILAKKCCKIIQINLFECKLNRLIFPVLQNFEKLFDFLN